MSNENQTEYEEALDKAKSYKGSVSRLRKEITKVSLLTEKAVGNLLDHLKGEKVEPVLIDDSKWVLNMLQQLYETAIKEESVKTRSKPERPRTRSKSAALSAPTEEQGNDPVEPEDATQPCDQETAKARFNMEFSPPPIDEENSGDDTELGFTEDTDF